MHPNLISSNITLWFSARFKIRTCDFLVARRIVFSGFVYMLAAFSLLYYRFYNVAFRCLLCASLVYKQKRY